MALCTGQVATHPVGDAALPCNTGLPRLQLGHVPGQSVVPIRVVGGLVRHNNNFSLPKLPSDVSVSEPDEAGQIHSLSMRYPAVLSDDEAFTLMSPIQQFCSTVQGSRRTTHPQELSVPNILLG